MFELSAEQLEFYRTNGYLLLDGIFDPEEMMTVSQEYDSLFRHKRDQGTELEATWTGDWKSTNTDNNSQQTSVESIHSVQCHSAVFTRMLLNTRLLDALEQIMGSKNISLHHTKAHLKPPAKGSPFPMHQDYGYFPYRDHSMVACFIHLDDSDQKNGGLTVYPGSHTLGPLPNVSNTNTHFYVDQSKWPLDGGVPVVAKAGQVVIFSYLLVHGSTPNISSRSRRMLLFQFMSCDDEPTRPAHSSPCQGMVLRGKNVHRNADISKRHDA